MAFSINDSELECMWQELEKGANDIYSNTISRSQFSHLYSLAYNFCTNNSYGSKESQQALYKKLASFLDGHAQIIFNRCKELTDESLLHLYAEMWQDYCFASKAFNGVFSYLNRLWVYRQRKKCGLDAKEVYHLTIASWQQFVRKPLQTGLSSAVLKLIEQERQGELINTKLIRTVLNSFYNEKENSSGSLNPDNVDLSLYKEEFEAKFLKETQLHYTAKSASILRDAPVTEFMKKIETWFTEEVRRVQLYLHRSTLKPLLQIIDDVVLSEHVGIFYPEFKTLLAHDKTEDLKRMYHLLIRVPVCKDVLIFQFEKFVTAEGLLAVEKYNSSGSNDSKAYITTLIDVCKRFTHTLVNAFEREKGFSSALARACEKFINKNAVTKSSSSKSVELLAKYFDLSLKRNRSKGQEIMDFSEACVILRYMEEKDTFQIFYTKLFAKRLVQQTNAYGNDEERTVITKLKEACGFEYTRKMENIFRDVCVSRKLTEDFKNEKNSRDIDFCINVIDSLSWPLNQSLTFSIPQELEESIQQFTNFYNSRFKGRNLTWLYGFSKGELASLCFEKKYTFQASTFQMAVLLQFNSHDQISFDQLTENTKIRSDILLQVLQGLVKMKLLRDVNGNSITESSSITLNMTYRNKKLKVDINTAIKSELRAEQAALHLQVEREKKILVQAAIVRIAKIRKVVKHNELLSEVLNQLASRCKPQIQVFNESIDVLIEKEYLRTEEDSYYYVT